MDRLVPLSKLEDDYYVGDYGRGPVESEEEESSDDEFQSELKKLAGIPTCAQMKKERERSEFADEMESDLDESISEYARKHMGGSNPDLTKLDEPPALVDPSTDTEMEASAPCSSKTVNSPENKLEKKKVTINEDVEMLEDRDNKQEEDESNPIKKLAKQSFKEEKEKPDFYDSDEDEDNERWMAERRRRSKGAQPDKMEKLTEKQRRAKTDDNSDAVLSCPGCMSLLTRDCQRHEVYKDQYRAMFVENVEVMDELMTVEETGKTKRNKRRKERKAGKEHVETASDLFYPVRCAVCKTSVAVVDLEEIYHFFNVLSGYS